MVGALLRVAQPVFFAVRTARVFHEFAQRHGGAAGLGREPFPMPGQQGHLAGHHAELGAASAACGFWRWLGWFGSLGGGCGFRHWQTREHFLIGAAYVHIHGAAGGVVEQQDRTGCALGQQLLESQCR